MPLARALPFPGLAPNRAGRSTTASTPARLRLLASPATVDPRERAAALYGEFGPLVYRRCRRLLRDQEAAADATQEVFMRLVRQGDALACRDELLPWLYRVTTNYCLNVLRDARGRREDLMESVEEGAEDPSVSTPGGRLLRRVLAQFDEATQGIAIGIIVEGKDAEELARSMGVSRRTVSRKLDRFLLLARQRLSEGTPARAR